VASKRPQHAKLCVFINHGNFRSEDYDETIGARKNIRKRLSKQTISELERLNLLSSAAKHKCVCHGCFSHIRETYEIQDIDQHNISGSSSSSPNEDGDVPEIPPVLSPDVQYGIDKLQNNNITNYEKVQLAKAPGESIGLEIKDD
jgi:hypothetical protein